MTSTGRVAMRMQGISKSFPGVRALVDVDLDVREGEIHAVVGENGAGKSTLMRVLAGIYRPDEGTIEIDGDVVEHWSPKAALARGIGMIYQELNLVPDLTVAENISLGNMPRVGPFVNGRAITERARSVLAELQANIDPDTRVGDLSISQQQLVEIAKVVAQRPRIVVLDEPTSSLGEQETEHLFDVIGRMRNSGIAVIYISHRLREVLEIGDRVTVLRDGRWIETRDVAGTTADDMVQLMVGRKLTNVFPKLDLEPGDKVLEVDSLTSAGSFTNVSFHVRAHEVVGFAGLVGSGRTEVVRAVFGLDPVDAGSIRIGDTAMAAGGPRRAVDAGIALVPEDRKQQGIVPDMSVRANTTLPTIHRLARPFIPKHERQVVKDLVDRLSINPPLIERRLNDFSGGNQQKVVLGKWLLATPDVLILDEPTRGVDVGAKADIHEIIGEFARDGGAVLMISSELPELLAVCDRLYVLSEGRIATELQRSEFSEETVMRFATGGVLA